MYNHQISASSGHDQLGGIGRESRPDQTVCVKNAPTVRLLAFWIPGYTREWINILNELKWHTDFKGKVGEHQRSELSPLLFMAIMDACEVWGQKGGGGCHGSCFTCIIWCWWRVRESWRRMYWAGKSWRSTSVKAIVSGKNYGDVEKTGKWLYNVRGKVVRSNSAHCRGCGG